MKKSHDCIVIRRGNSLLISIAVLMCMLTSCGKVETGFITYEKNETIQTTLTFFGNINATSKMPAIEALITDYMDLHPDINIVYEGIDPSLSVDYNTLLSKRLSTGNGDDIFFSYAGFLPTLVENGYVEPLDDLASWSGYGEDARNLLFFQQHYYGIPMEQTVIGLYCNLDVLEKYNLEAPETYADFMKCCDVLKLAGLAPIASSQLLPFSGYAYADGLAKLYQTEKAKELRTALANGDDTYGKYFLQGFEQLQSMLELGYIERETTLAHDTTEQAEQAFAKGESAFLLGASDLNASIINENPDLNYAVYPIPVCDGESVVLSVPDHLLCVNAAGANKELALDFVEFCTKRENIERYVKKQGSLSPLADAQITENYLAPVSNIISDGRALPSVNYQLTERLQNWVHQAGLTLLNGETPQQAASSLDDLIPVQNNQSEKKVTP